MIIEGIEIPDIFIKVCGRRRHAEDVANGKIYMKKVSYYRWVENNYMGDALDSLGPINGIQILNSKGENFFDVFPNMIPVIGDLLDNTPVYCVAMLDGRVAHVENESIKLNEEFKNELLKFGKHFVLFNGNEFIDHAMKWAKDKHINCMGRPVEYCDIWKAYGGKDLLHKSAEVPYYKKDFSYINQNEWRFVLLNKGLIPENKDFYVMEIEKMKTTKILSSEEFKEFSLDIKNKVNG